jgi:2-polyprenyl-6-hydroxyphenyl methylase/3-demethylubiquinone-9 3-methyltransferase
VDGFVASYVVVESDPGGHEMPTAGLSYLIGRMTRFLNDRVLKKWASFSTKKAIWDAEFATGKWDFLEDLRDQRLYHYLEKYSNNGDILDLGCGAGNTGNEIADSKYRRYIGIDVSEIAIRHAVDRSLETRRQHKNRYICDDIFSYVPSGTYQVILFRESLFYIPTSRISGLLKRYSKHLNDSGVFVVSMYGSDKHRSIIRLIEDSYHIVDRASRDGADVILVFH